MFEKKFKATQKGTIKKEKLKDERFEVAQNEKLCSMWLGRGNEVARTPPLS